MNIVEDRNNAFLVDYRGHKRTMDSTRRLRPHTSVSVSIWHITTTIFCRIRWSASKTFPRLGSSLPVVTNAGSCTAYDSTQSASNERLLHQPHTLRHERAR